MVRLRALDRDNWECVQCGKKGRLQVDHIVSLNDGGALYDLSHLQSLCFTDHIAKTRLENTPERPEVTAWRHLLAAKQAQGV